MANDAPELPLEDWKQRLTQKINSAMFGSDTSWYIFCKKTHTGRAILWLGERTHDLGGTSYSMHERITLEQAEWLLQTTFDKSPFKQFSKGEQVYDFCDAIKSFKTALPTIGEFIGA